MKIQITLQKNYFIEEKEIEIFKKWMTPFEVEIIQEESTGIVVQRASGIGAYQNLKEKTERFLQKYAKFQEESQ